MHRVAKWLSAISANIGWTFPGPRSRLVFRLSSPCTLEIIQCGFCKGFLRVIEFLLVQKSMKSCTFKKKKKGKIQCSDFANPNAPSATTWNCSFFHYLTTYRAPKERLVRKRTAMVVFPTSVLCTEERFQSYCEIVQLCSSRSTPDDQKQNKQKTLKHKLVPPERCPMWICKNECTREK